ncbi:MAG: hypothetical protein SYC29_17890 [Planctomycetota bacterium]|nr:hypothetical protein [Planctomycetota bacterium]
MTLKSETPPSKIDGGSHGLNSMEFASPYVSSMPACAEIAVAVNAHNAMVQVWFLIFERSLPGATHRGR